MTPLLLQDALAKFLEDALGAYALDTNTEIKKAPQIVKIGNQSEEARPFGIAEYTASNIDVFIIDLFNKIK